MSVSPFYYGRPELFKLRYYNRNDLAQPLQSITVDWYAQGRIRVIPIRIINETTLYTPANDYASSDEEVVLNSTAGLVVSDKLLFPSGEVAEILQISGSSVFLARGINGLLDLIYTTDSVVAVGAPFQQITLSLSEDDDDLSAAILSEGWLGIKSAEDEAYTPLGEYTIPDLSPGEHLDLDLRLYIPPYNLGEDLCATTKIDFPTGESFINLETSWHDPNQHASIYGDFLYSDRLFYDFTEKTPPGNYHRPLLQVNYYSADEVAFLELNGVEFPGDSL